METNKIIIRKVKVCDKHRTTFASLQKSIPVLGRYELGFEKEEALKRIEGGFVFFIKKDGIVVGVIDYETENKWKACVNRIVVIGSKKEESLLLEEIITMLSKKICIATVITDADPGLHHHFIINMYHRLGFTMVRTYTAPHGHDYKLTLEKEQN